MARMSPVERRQMIIDAALAVARRKGLGATTVRDVAHAMGTSSGLIHHYFESMDEVLAAAFAQAAGRDLAVTKAALKASGDPAAQLATFFASYTRDDDGAMQLWLDAWAEAARRPVLRRISRRLNVTWQRLLADIVERGVADGRFCSDDPQAAAWRMLSMLDGLALQTVAHRRLIDPATAVAWAVAAAEQELGLAVGALSPAT